MSELTKNTPPVPEDKNTQPVSEGKNVPDDKSTHVIESQPADTVVTNEVVAPEAEEDVIPVPPVEEPFYDLRGRIAHFGFSQTGQSHLRYGTPCQDRCHSAYVPGTNLFVGAIADGVGSCALSDLGAHTAVHSAVDCVCYELEKNIAVQLDGAMAGTILRKAFQYAYDQVAQTAQQHEQLLFSLQSTLTVAIYDGTNLYFGHAGDDGIVALTADRKLDMATTRHKGEEASSVYPLQSKATWQFGMVPNTVAFVMVTDGVLDAFVPQAAEENEVYYPFVEQIFTQRYKSKEHVKAVCNDMYAYMNSDKYRSTVTDDLTLIAVMNRDKMSSCLPKFDADAWYAKRKQYEEKVNKVLYDKTTPKANHPKSHAKHGNPAQAPETTCGPAEPAPQHSKLRGIFSKKPHKKHSPRQNKEPRPNRNPYSVAYDHYGTPDQNGQPVTSVQAAPESAPIHSNTGAPHQAPSAPQPFPNATPKPKQRRRRFPPALSAFLWSLALLITLMSAYYGIKLALLIIALLLPF